MRKTPNTSTNMTEAATTVTGTRIIAFAPENAELRAED